MTRRVTEETRLSEPVRMKSGWENFGRINAGKDIEGRLSLGHRERKCLDNKGRERN